MPPDKFAYFDDDPRFKGFKWISPSQASKVLNCPWSWWAAYPGGVESEPSQAMDRGTVFDGVCGYGRAALTLEPEVKVAASRLTEMDVHIIQQRAEAQKATMPRGRGQVPVYMPLEGTEWHLRGFVDWVPDDDSLPFRELKLATVPWHRKKLKYNMMQPLSYTKMLKGRPGQIDVSNMDAPGIQVFNEKDYLRRRKFDTRWAEVLENYHEAIAIIEGGVYKPTPGILCKGANEHTTWQCDYWAVCPYIIEQRNKEMKINGIRERF